MGSAVGVALAARVMPVRQLASLRRDLRLKGSTRPPTAFRPIFGGREADSSYHVATHNNVFSQIPALPLSF